MQENRDRTDMTKRDRIQRELRMMIQSGEMPHGTWMRQDDLSERFATSTTPVREALRQLEAEGLLSWEPYRGVRVTSVAHADLAVIYVMRRFAEGYAMQRATRRMSPLDIDRSAALLDEMTQSHSSGNTRAVQIANRNFHFSFYGHSAFPKLEKEIERLWQRYPWDILEVLVDRVPKSIEEHQRILDAVRSGDLQEVGDATEAHIRTGYMAIAAHRGLDVHQDPFLTDVDVD